MDGAAYAADKVERARSVGATSEDLAAERFRAFTEEATRWKGVPERRADDGARRLAVWPDLEIRQAGRGVMVRARAPWFSHWWHEEKTWEGGPMGAIWAWLEEERKRGVATAPL